MGRGALARMWGIMGGAFAASCLCSLSCLSCLSWLSWTGHRMVSVEMGVKANEHDRASRKAKTEIPRDSIIAHIITERI